MNIRKFYILIILVLILFLSISIFLNIRLSIKKQNFQSFDFELIKTNKKNEKKEDENLKDLFLNEKNYIKNDLWSIEDLNSYISEKNDKNKNNTFKFSYNDHKIPNNPNIGYPTVIYGDYPAKNPVSGKQVVFQQTTYDAFFKLSKPLNITTDNILILLMTYHGAIKSRQIQILNSWGKRFKHFYFISDKENKKYKNIAKPGPNKFDKTAAQMNYLGGIKHFYDKGLFNNDEIKWVYLGDDDSFINVDSLLRFLQFQNYEIPVVFGRILDYFTPQMTSGGAGELVSINAFKMVGNNLLKKDVCPFWSVVDVTLNICFRSLQIPLVNNPFFNIDNSRSVFIPTYKNILGFTRGWIINQMTYHWIGNKAWDEQKRLTDIATTVDSLKNIKKKILQKKVFHNLKNMMKKYNII